MAVAALHSHLEGFYEAEVFGSQAHALEDARLLTASERPAEVPEELSAFEAAAEGFAAVGDERGRAEALLWQGLYGP